MMKTMHHHPARVTRASRRSRWNQMTTLAGLALAATFLIGSGPHAESSSTAVDAMESSAPGHRFGQTAPAPRTPGAIRVASYNVLNLFDHVDDPSLQGEHDDIKMATSDARCRGIAEAIRAMDADIVALQEVESLECLTWFRDTYLSDLGYTHLASEDVGYFRGVECSLMSRFPLSNVTVWPKQPLTGISMEGPGWSDVPSEADRPLEYRRSPMRVDVTVNDDYELTLFVLHHKSGSRYRYQREAEAMKNLTHIGEVLESEPNRNVIVLGDFNAAPWDKSLRVYLEAGFVDVFGHRIIPRWRNADETEADLFKTHESGRVLDYILLNSAAHRELVIGSPHVYGTVYDPDYDWRKDPYPDGYASDHYPIIIDIMPKNAP